MSHYPKILTSEEKAAATTTSSYYYMIANEVKQTLQQYVTFRFMPKQRMSLVPSVNQILFYLFASKHVITWSNHYKPIATKCLSSKTFGVCIFFPPTAHTSQFPVAGTNFSEEKTYLRNLCQHTEWLICVLWLLHWSSFQAARTAASINCQILFLISSTEFYFVGLILLFNFIEGFWSSYNLRFVSMEFYFPRFPPM